MPSRSLNAHGDADVSMHPLDFFPYVAVFISIALLTFYLVFPHYILYSVLSVRNPKKPISVAPPSFE